MSQPKSNEELTRQFARDIGFMPMEEAFMKALAQKDKEVAEALDSYVEDINRMAERYPEFSLEAFNVDGKLWLNTRDRMTEIREEHTPKE